MVATTALFHSGDGGDSGFFPQWQQSAKEGLFPQRQWWRHGLFPRRQQSAKEGLFPQRQWRRHGLFPRQQWRQRLLSMAALETMASFHGGNKQLMKACFHGGSGNNGLFPWRQW